MTLTTALILAIIVGLAVWLIGKSTLPAVVKTIIYIAIALVLLSRIF